MITATYSPYGYQIYSDNKEIYSAGNSIFDSQIYLEPHTPGALDLPTIRDYCASTAREFSQERNEPITAIEHDEESTLSDESEI